MSLTLRPIGHSEIGLVRKSNQDSGFISPTLVFVADGMGGAAAGDLASAVTANEVQHANDIPMAGKGALTALRIAIVKANNDLAELILRAPELDGMGTTICGGIFDGESLNIAHIGDSRGYLLRDGELSRLTHDHSYVQTLIDDGRLDEEGALIHPHRSLIMKVLNGQPDIAPDYFSVDLRAGDRIMFCSDGLCGLVRDADIAEGLVIADPALALTTLVKLAHDHGGTDNITIILADVVESNPKPLGGTGEQPALPGVGHATDEQLVVDADEGSDQPAALTTEDESGAPATDQHSDEVAPPETSHSPDTAPTPAAATAPADAGSTDTLGSPDTLSASSNGAPHENLRPAPAAPEVDSTTVIHADEFYQTSGLLGAAADPSLEELLNILRHQGTRAAATTSRPTPAPTPTPAHGHGHGHGSKKSERKSASALAAQQEQERYRPVAKRSRLAVWLIILAVLVVLGGGGWGVYTYVTHQYYVADHEGKVTIFEGIPGDIAGIQTNRVYQSTDVKLTDLPLVWRDKVTGIIPIDFNDLDQAQSTVDQLRDLSEQCVERRADRPAGEPTPADGC